MLFTYYIFLVHETIHLHLCIHSSYYMLPKPAKYHRFSLLTDVRSRRENC